MTVRKYARRSSVAGALLEEAPEIDELKPRGLPMTERPRHGFDEHNRARSFRGKQNARNTRFQCARLGDVAGKLSGRDFISFRLQESGT